MKNKLPTTLTCIMLAIVSAQGQIAFQNLSFEAAHNLPVSGEYVAVLDGIPGWTAMVGINVLSTIPYNFVIGVPKVGLYGSNAIPISGTFSVLLSANGSIHQTGLIPNVAQSLFFKDRSYNLPPLEISLGGQSLSLVTMSTGANYTLYGADISSFSGQTATLELLAGTLTEHLIDDIEFSPQPIPEPTSLTLVGLSGALLLTRRRLNECR